MLVMIDMILEGGVFIDAPVRQFVKTTWAGGSEAHRDKENPSAKMLTSGDKELRSIP